MAAQTRLIYEFDDFQVEPDEHRLRRRGEVVPLHGKAFELLLTLVRNHGRLLTKDEILEQVWPDQIVEESNLTVNMSAIRRALGERASNPHYIKTVSGRGYRFTGDVHQFADEAFTIERETFARVVVEQEETESGSRFWPSAREIANTVRRITSHPLLLLATCVAVLAIGELSFWASGLHRGAAKAPLPWTNVSIGRFATHGGLPFRVAISPDGKSLVYVQRIEGKASLWLGQIESNSSVQILEQPDVTYNGLTFSPDGQSVYVSEYDSAKLLRLPAVGGVPTELIQHVDSAVSFSPDGSQLAFLRGGSGGTAIIIADAADGRNERTLIIRTRVDDFSSSGLSWSPDGKTIAVAAKSAASGQVQLLAVAVSDGSVKRISDYEWGEVGNVKWQADGSGLLFTKRFGPLSRRSEIWFAPYPAGEPRKITNDLNQYLIQNLSLSASGILAVLDGVTESEIWIAPNGDATQARRVLQGITPKYEGVDGLTWTPDGHLLYTAYVGDGLSIWEMNRDGSNRRQLTSNGSDFVDRQMSVTADNRYIVFHSNRSGSLQIWRANRDGSDLRQLTSGANNILPTLSPDSKWIVYMSDGPAGSALWRMSIDGEQVTQLTHDQSSNPQISPDGKHLAYLASSGSGPLHLEIISFPGSAPEKTFALPSRPGPNLAKRMCWTPDSKALIYRDSMQGLWMQRLDEEKPQLIKGFESVQTTQLSWSANGKALAYTRAANMQQILLLQNSR